MSIEYDVFCHVALSKHFTSHFSKSSKITQITQHFSQMTKITIRLASLTLTRIPCLSHRQDTGDTALPDGPVRARQPGKAMRSQDREGPSFEKIQKIRLEKIRIELIELDTARYCRDCRTAQTPPMLPQAAERRRAATWQKQKQRLRSF